MIETMCDRAASQAPVPLPLLMTSSVSPSALQVSVTPRSLSMPMHASFTALLGVVALGSNASIATSSLRGNGRRSAFFTAFRLVAPSWACVRKHELYVCDRVFANLDILDCIVLERRNPCT